MATTAATEPSTIPAIAPPDNPLLLSRLKVLISGLYSKVIFPSKSDIGYNRVMLIS